jgi:hypothetical protein
MLRDDLLTGFKLWGVRRVQSKTALEIAGALIALSVFVLWNWRVSAIAAGGLLVAVGYVKLRLGSSEEAPPSAGDGWVFGGERFAYRSVSEVADRRPSEITDRLAARYRPDQTVEMVLWIVAKDGTGQPWTLVQDRFGAPLASITASAVGEVPGACDPYLEAQRLSLSETGLALVDVLVLGWGTDSSLDLRRDVIVVVGHTGVGAEKLGSHIYEGGGRRSHLIELHPDSVCRSLGSVDARRWQAGAVRGLVQTMEVLYPGAGPLLEEMVEEPWRSRRMFARLGRLTDGRTDRDLKAVDPVVLKVVNGGIVEEQEVRRRPEPDAGKPREPDRALSWEATARAVPTRYR